MLKKITFLLHLSFLILLFSEPALLFKEKPKVLKLHFKPASKQQSTHIASSTTQTKTAQPLKKITKPVPVVTKALPQKKPATVKQHTTQKKTLKPIKKPLKASEETILERKQKETIAKIEEKIDKLEQITQGEIRHTTPDEQITSSSPTDNLSCSVAEVIQYLFQVLELPGSGKVVIEMKLSKQGKIEKVTVLESENETNSLYLIENLTHLELPFNADAKIPTHLNVCFSNLQA